MGLISLQRLPHPVTVCQPLLLRRVLDIYLERGPAEGQLLYSLDEYLGAPAPLLAYTKLTGDAWLRTLPPSEAKAAAPLLADFRAFLRDEGWLDAARPVNQFD